MSDASDPVLEQYLSYPYPPRDPADERKRLITGSPSHLDEVAHFVFGGRLRPEGFRALVAGGGTGDAAIMLAQQLKDAGGGEVVYLDISEQSRAVAAARAEVRGLDNISFHLGQIEELPQLGLGAFDYIDCCGVLHHLEDPPAGLRALRAVLKDGGGMGLMLYAPYGRTGVYPMQEMLRALGAGQPLAERVKLARRLWQKLPETNWLRHNPYLGDHQRSDAELVDLLLHARDRPYTVEQVAEFLDTAELRPAAFVEPLRYDPAAYVNDPALLKPLKDAGLVARAAFAERLAGNIRKHVFYAVPAERGDTVARPTPEAVPVPRDLDPQEFARGAGPSPGIRVDFDRLTLRFALPARTAAIMARIDGRRSLDAIFTELEGQDSGLARQTLETQFDQLFRVLNGINKLYLRYPG